jgi:ribonuclease HIII
MKAPSKIVLPSGSAGAVKEKLQKEGFSFSEQEHAFWHAESGGTHIIFYRSGTVLLQGKDHEREKWFEVLRGTGPGGKKDAGHNDRVLGLDESGKGDFFGPLVLAGAVVSGHDHKELSGIGVEDSKKLSDGKIKDIFRKLRDHAEFQVRVIEPEEYNRLYTVHKNLNRLMMDEYKKLIGKFGADRYDRIILDQFSSSDRQNSDLRHSLDKEILIVTRAESNASVALASIVARYHFVDWIERTSRRVGFEIPIGSGPVSGQLFRKLKNGTDRELFLSLAKAHFKSGSGDNSLFE